MKHIIAPLLFEVYIIISQVGEKLQQKNKKATERQPFISKQLSLGINRPYTARSTLPLRRQRVHA